MSSTYHLPIPSLDDVKLIQASYFHNPRDKQTGKTKRHAHQMDVEIYTGDEIDFHDCQWRSIIALVPYASIQSSLERWVKDGKMNQAYADTLASKVAQVGKPKLASEELFLGVAYNSKIKQYHVDQYVLAISKDKVVVGAVLYAHGKSIKLHDWSQADHRGNPLTDKIVTLKSQCRYDQAGYHSSWATARTLQIAAE